MDKSSKGFFASIKKTLFFFKAQSLTELTGTG